MKLLINNVIAEETALAADTTALNYLRENRGLTGTKEGCASGDCGACTIMVGSLEGDEINYSTANACITPIHSLVNKHIVTVEHLEQDNKLHPSQQAMIENHGSQCGFCTPGFVMSLACLHDSVKSNTTISREQVCDAISGNLCRCTGYRPIIDAGLDMAAYGKSTLADKESIYIDQLKTITSVACNEQNSSFLQPSDLNALFALMARHPQACLIAGGTDLMLEHTQRYQNFEALIDLSEIEALKHIDADDEHLRIGSSVTYSDLEHSDFLQNPSLLHFLSRIASRQIRNRGTVGGNIANASPIADLPPLFIALNAKVEIFSSANDAKSVPISDFYQGYRKTILQNQEIIGCVSFPIKHLEHHLSIFKVSKRIEDDISSVMLAARFEVTKDRIVDASIGLGGVAVMPYCAEDVAREFVGKSISDKSALDAAVKRLRSELNPISDVRASAQYREDMASNLLHKAWLELSDISVVRIDSKLALQETGNA